jgi:hypothetical protein
MQTVVLENPWDMIWLGIPGTPHLIHPHVQNVPLDDHLRALSGVGSFGFVKISVVSPYRHKTSRS